MQLLLACATCIYLVSVSVVIEEAAGEQDDKKVASIFSYEWISKGMEIYSCLSRYMVMVTQVTMDQIM